MIKLPVKKANIEYHKEFLTSDEATKLKDTLLKTIEFKTRALEGRPTALFGDTDVEYIYAKNAEKVTPWTKELLQLKELVEKHTGYKYNVCLLNYYENGKKKFGFHSDNEEIGNSVPIASISLGAERKFYFKRQKNDENEEEEICVVLENGSMLVMKEGTHENYLHALPPDNSIKSDRLNITFRYKVVKEIKL